ncbi:hypothetical protein TKK_0014659 [Trichogramma kaykai]
MWRKKKQGKTRRKAYSESTRIRKIGTIVKHRENQKRRRETESDTDHEAESPNCKKNKVDKVNDEDSQIVHSSVELSSDESNADDNCVKSDENPEIKDIETDFSDKTPNGLEKLKNGLIADPQHYYQNRSSRILVCKILTDKSPSTKCIEVSALYFTTLQRARWVNGIILDAFTATIIKEKDDLCFLPTDHTKIMIGDKEVQSNKLQNRYISKIKEKFANTILLPYLYNCHYRYETGYDDSERVMEDLNKFIENSSSQSSFQKLLNIKWQREYCSKRPYQKNDDGSSCGVYVANYIEMIASKNDFREDLAVDEYRLHISKTILSASQNMIKCCLHCFNEITVKANSCVECNRQWHPKCNRISEMNSDMEDIEKPEKNRKQKKKYTKCIKREGTTPSKYCRVCRKSLNLS